MKCYNDECYNIREGKTMFCASCNRQMRKYEADQIKEQSKRNSLIAKAKLKQKEVKPAINKVSDKRKELNNEYFRLVPQFKKDNPDCRARIKNICTGKTTDPHHRRGRGKYLLDITTWLPVCRECHIYIENHPEEAKERGWSESRLSVNQEPHKI